jgi:hypothetical protein
VNAHGVPNQRAGAIRSFQENTCAFRFPAVRGQHKKTTNLLPGRPISAALLMRELRRQTSLSLASVLLLFAERFPDSAAMALSASEEVAKCGL